MKRFVRVGVVAMGLALASGAWAFHCPADMAKIDAALAKKPDVSQEVMAQVKQLRAQGESLHQAGKHQEAVDALAKAMTLLGI